MAFLFRNKQKNNLELTRSIKELTLRLGQEDKANPKVRLHKHKHGDEAAGKHG